MYVMPDPEAAMINYLKAQMTARMEPYRALTVTPKFPDSSATYHVQVELEAGNTDDYPATERSQVRFTCWAPAGRRSDVKDLAALTQALVLTFPGSATVAGTSSLGGRSDVSEDPDTQRLMCWFLARVNLLPVAL